MAAWTIFWGLLLLVTLSFYSVLVVYVTIGGFSDIKQMFKKLAAEDEDSAAVKRDAEVENSDEE